MDEFLPSAKRMCHRTGFTKSCLKLVQSGACERWKHLQGMNRNTGQMMVMAGRCIDDMLPDLMIENTQMQRETGAAVESFRNEMEKANEQMAVLLSQELRQQLLDRVPQPNGEMKTIEHKTKN